MAPWAWSSGLVRGGLAECLGDPASLGSGSHMLAPAQIRPCTLHATGGYWLNHRLKGTLRGSVAEGWSSAKVQTREGCQAVIWAGGLDGAPAALSLHSHKQCSTLPFLWSSAEFRHHGRSLCRGGLLHATPSPKG